MKLIKWFNIEMRIKLNDAGESNGEFLFFFDGALTSHVTGLTDMMPSGVDNLITQTRFWCYMANPVAEQDQTVFFKDYYATKFSSDPNPGIFTTPEPTASSTTTHPITTTIATTTTTTTTTTSTTTITTTTTTSKSD